MRKVVESKGVRNREMIVYISGADLTEATDLPARSHRSHPRKVVVLGLAPIRWHPDSKHRL